MRLPNAMHLLHAMWQFIARLVGTRFIASAYAPWHFLYFLPLSHGHGSLRPTFPAPLECAAAAVVLCLPELEWER